MFIDWYWPSEICYIFFPNVWSKTAKHLTLYILIELSKKISQKINWEGQESASKLIVLKYLLD